MTDMGRVIKAEIERLVVRELKSTEVIRELTALARRIAQLEGTIASLETRVAQSVSAALANSRARVSSNGGRRGRQFKATPEAIRKMRARLGITQGELAALLSVSGNAVWQWEAGRAKPRGKKLKFIQDIGRLGKREVRRRLLSLAAPAAS